jgi:squalene-hopene/tetraprenyl-beta-curcumene cyclase
MRRLCWFVQLGVAVCLVNRPVHAGEPDKALSMKGDEPLAKEFSLEKARDSLDALSVRWIEKHKCGSCHTTYPYLMVRPALKDSAAHKEVRDFIEKRATNWDSGKKEDKPRGDAEIVITAAALAVNDARTTGKLHPLTRRTLDRIWTLQKPDGGWDWYKCGWPPFELDDYYGAVVAAVGVGHAPEGYAGTEKAKAGLKKLRGYFKNTPPPNLHHKAWLLWASVRLDGLLSPEEQQKTVKDLLALQRADGGWSLASMAEWEGQAGKVDGKNAPSDGYGTGLVVYVLRQAGVPAEDKAIRRGVAWLKSNQRESGAWFTQTLNGSQHQFLAHTATAYAVLALKACEQTDN